jgi:hypothetical protein
MYLFYSETDLEDITVTMETVMLPLIPSGLPSHSVLDPYIYIYIHMTESCQIFSIIDQVREDRGTN